MTTNISSKVSLINLSKQLPFEIDNEVRKDLCFGESLIISCGHNERNIYDDESDDSCSTKSGSEPQQLIEFPQKDYEIKNNEEIAPEEINETGTETSSVNDFHIYFFPECDKGSIPLNSTTSIVIEDGLPKINLAAKTNQQCMCKTKTDGQCICYEKNTCDCMKSHTNSGCSCSKVDQICLCKSDEPISICNCKDNETCFCLGEPVPICTCDQIKPCLCNSKEAFSTCDCYNNAMITASPIISHNSIPIIDGNFECIGDDSHPCTCDHTNSSSNPEQCPCSKTNTCNCGNPSDCKCYHCCECEKPCICDYIIEKTDKEAIEKNTCQCNKNTNKTGSSDSNLKLKKVRVTKHGYRWCHDVDPHHTFFDFGYGRHDKILPNDDIIQKVNILGLHNDDEYREIEGQKAEAKLPKYKKAVVKPSFDCCSVVGGITINVETLGEDKNKFLVQIVSHAAKEGAKTGTKLVSIVDLNLHTLEENRIENIMKENVTKEKRSYMSICDTGYYNKITRICGERNIVKRLYHSYEDAHDFLLEGGNIILMRYFGLRRFKGSVKTKTVLIKGDICESIYVCQGVSQAIVNGKPLFVVKVERHIIEPNGFIQQTLTVLTLRGYMVSHEWSNHNYILHLNPLLNIIPEKDEIERHEPLRGRWREDMQLMSDYLDFKSQRSSEGGRYIAENGPLAETIRNYLQTLLLLRPGDALQFTRSYFNAALSSLDLPHDEYFDNCGKRVRYFFFEE